MGIVLDSSVLIASERAGLNSKQAFAAILRKTGNDEVALSVITLLELAHGAVRANTTERKQKRERIIQELLSAVPIHPITASIALRAGQIDGQSQASGIRIPLLICSSVPLLWNLDILSRPKTFGTSNKFRAFRLFRFRSFSRPSATCFFCEK